ncbi:hypothetical protein DFH11DRAFT_1542995 [Phellopilus nigrolimitatus]|nr:hypothetical protein DFH11DRAFT_1542995 [Phellopilus nigrolimitatus]
MPKRYTVPIQPPPTLPPQQPALVTSNSTTSIKGATRGKRGTIKACAHGGGLLHGTVRMRPGGGLRPTASKKQHVTQKRVIQKQPTATAWPVPMPSVRDILERDSSSDRLKSAKSANLSAKTRFHGKEKCVSLGGRILLNYPTHASLPPPSPVLPPVPPKSRLAPNLQDLRALDLGATALCLARSESDTSSNSIGMSFTACASAEEGSPGEERPYGLSNSSILMAARHLQAIFSSGAADSKQAKEERRLREEQTKEEEEHRRAWDLMGEVEREARADRMAGKVKEAKLDGVETTDPARWSELFYNYGGNSNPSLLSRLAHIREAFDDLLGVLADWEKKDDDEHILLEGVYKSHVHLRTAGEVLDARRNMLELADRSAAVREKGLLKKHVDALNKRAQAAGVDLAELDRYDALEAAAAEALVKVELGLEEPACRVQMMGGRSVLAALGARGVHGQEHGGGGLTEAPRLAGAGGRDASERQVGRVWSPEPQRGVVAETETMTATGGGTGTAAEIETTTAAGGGLEMTEGCGHVVHVRISGPMDGRPAEVEVISADTETGRSEDPTAGGDDHRANAVQAVPGLLQVEDALPPWMREDVRSLQGVESKMRGGKRRGAGGNRKSQGLRGGQD